MKKLLFLGICCLYLCGCNKNWENDFQTSDIKIKISKGFSREDTYLTYSIKNISNYTCDSIAATIEFKSGSLTVDETIYPSYSLKKGETKEFESVIMGKNYDDYTATFKEINCYDKGTGN